MRSTTYQPIVEAIVPFVLARDNGPPRILCPGSGTGRLPYMIAEQLGGAQIIALDPDVNAQRAAALMFNAAADDAPISLPTRIFPSLLQQVSGVNDEAWAGLQAFERPFLTLWGERDPLLGSEMMQARLVDNVPGAEGQPHDRFADAGHFLQEDQGEEIARRMVELIANDR